MDSLPLETCLDQLKCSICNRFLSVFPIFAIKDGKDSQLLSVCGRCQVPSENENLIILRNEIYENLAKIIKFPCIYHQNGCMEKLLPETMKQHELECYYRNVNCCFYEDNTCEWKGSFQQLFKHYEIEHQDLFLKDLQFEFKLLENHNVTNILQYSNELFRFKRNFKQETNQLNCSVIPLGIPIGIAKNYYGQINLSTTDATISKNLPEIHVDLNKSKSVDLFVHSILNGIDTKVVGAIKIGDSIEELNSIYVTEQFRQLLRTMKCSLCQNKKDIYSYQEDGFLCYDCHIEFSNNVTPSDQLAKQVGIIIFQKCPDYCGFIENNLQLTIHFHSCIFKPIDCVFVKETNCLWKGRQLDLFEHLLENHEQAIVKLNEFEQLEIDAESTLRQQYKITKYFHYYDCLFRFEITIQHEKVSFSIKEEQSFLGGVWCYFEFEMVLEHVRNGYLAANFKIVAKHDLDYNFPMDQIKDSNTISFKYKINVSKYEWPY